jgi:serine/threonine-protein kinase RsbW
MTDPDCGARQAEPDFVRVGAADAHTAAQLRIEFSHWLRRRCAIDSVRFSDVVLVVNEALANAAEFAYVDSPRVGTVTIEASYGAADNRLDVRVSDHGTWRETGPALRSNARGRGIPLMEALADRATIDRTVAGTVVHLQFDDVVGADTKMFAASA